MLDEVVLTFFSRLQVFLNTSAQEIYSLQSHLCSFLSAHFVRNLCEAVMFFWRFIDTFSATKFGFGEWLMKETAVSIRINWKRVREGLRLWEVMGRELVFVNSVRKWIHFSSNVSKTSFINGNFTKVLNKNEFRSVCIYHLRNLTSKLM